MKSVFECLRTHNPILYSPFTVKRWSAAVAEHERLLEPVEQHIAGNLRTQLSNIMDRPRQLLKELERCRNVLTRPYVLKHLEGDREAMLQASLSSTHRRPPTPFAPRVAP